MPYDIRADGVYLDGKPLDGADPALFETVHRHVESHYDSWADDGIQDPYSHTEYLVGRDRQLFFAGQPAPHIDAQSYTVTQYPWGQDANHVYFGAEPLEGATPTNFELLDSDFGRSGGKLYLHAERLEGVDADSLHIYHAALFKDQHAVWYRQDGQLKQIPQADPASYEPLAQHYARDHRFAYYFHKQIKHAKGASFSVIPLKIIGESVYIESLAHDGEHLFHCGDQVAPGVDLDSFETISETFSRDKNVVYYHYQPIVGSDPASFQTRNPYYNGDDWAKDAHSVYHYGKRVDGANPATDPNVQWEDGGYPQISE